MGWSHTDWTYNLIVPTSEMLCMSFVELLEMTYQALVFLYGRRLEVERTLS
jgi:hypothetical protein